MVISVCIQVESPQENLHSSIGVETPTPVDESIKVVEEQRIIEFTGILCVQLSTRTPWASVRYSLDGEPVRKTSRIYR